MTGSGVYQILKRWADQAAYEPDVRPHQFRHLCQRLAADRKVTFRGPWPGLIGRHSTCMPRIIRFNAIETKRRRANIY
jgi:hypothetical protein